MIGAFESTARVNPDQVFFTFVNAEGAETAFTYRQTRLIAATLARYLRANGVGRDDVVVVDLPNSPEYVFLLLAAGYGSFTIACTEQGVTHTGQYLRLFDFNRNVARVACTIDIDAAEELMAIVGSTFTEEQDHINTIEESVAAHASARPHTSAPIGASGPVKRASGPFRRSAANSRNGAAGGDGAERTPTRRSAPNRRRRSSLPIIPLGRAAEEAEPRRNSMKRDSGPIMGEHQDALEDAVHYAEREAHLFSPDARAVILFTAAVAGKHKLVPLTWQQIADSADAANHSAQLANGGRPTGDSWQVVLPFSHAIGLQTLARAIEGRAPLRVYERFDAERLLRDTETRHTTAVALTDAMLQEMIVLEEDRSDVALEREQRAVAVALQEGYFDNNDQLNDAFARARASVATSTRLSNYTTIQLIGLPLNPDTVEAVLEHDLPVRATYGMAETAGVIAETRLSANFTGGLRLHHGYSARIIEPDPQGFGRLAVHGGGVFSGYLNARAAFTVDGYFLTGDAAALHNGSIYVREQAVEVFAGKNGPVYPQQIAEVLRELPDVADAYVFGVPELLEAPVVVPNAFASAGGGALGGAANPYPNTLFMENGLSQASALSTSRPVAMVERRDIHLHPDDIYNYLATRLPDMETPRSIAIVDELPRHGSSLTVDRERVMALYGQRLEVTKVVLYHLSVPFRKPVRLHGDILTHRDCIIVEVTDHLGRTGLGECVPSTSAWTDAIGLEKSAAYLQQELVPTFIDRPLMHPREASALFATLPRATEHRFATTALGMALWDLYGKIQQRPFWSLLNEEYQRLRKRSGAPQRTDNLPRAAALKGDSALVTSSRTLGLGPVDRTLEAVEKAVRAGYRRVRFRITPEHTLDAIEAVQERFPDLLITLDGNRSFFGNDTARLRELDELGVGWIEEPLNPSAGFDGRTEMVKQLSALQRTLATPVSVDESFADRQQASRVLDFHDLRCIGVKVPKFGSVENALAFVVQAQTAGRALWVGATFDSAILKRVAAAFETLPGIVIPGDIDSPLRIYTLDITFPSYTLNRGYVVLNESPYDWGLGVELNQVALNEVLVKRTTIE